MISHKYKCIFIHIPKTAGSSINEYLAEGVVLDWKKPNYEVLYGWCPDRKIHLQHATSKQLLETELVTENQWETYFKFTFVRNPWDRAYSDYLWIMKDRSIKGTFKEYIFQTGEFDYVLNDNNTLNFRGDHILQQLDFFNLDGDDKVDFIGRFENFSEDIKILNNRLKIPKPFDLHAKKNTNRLYHYSQFYTNSQKKLIEEKYKIDIESLNYNFEDLRKGFRLVKKIL